MKFRIAFFFLLVSMQHVSAQMTRIDSLLQFIAEEQEDARRFDAILGIFSPEFEDDPNLIIETGWKLLQIGQQSRNIMSEAAAFSFFGHGYRLVGNPIKGLEYHIKAMQLAEKSGNQSVLALVKNQMAHVYKDREANRKAIQLYLEAEQHAIKGGNEIMQIRALMNAGATYLNTNQLDSALMYLQRAYEQSIRLKYNNQLAYILTNLGGVQSNLGNSALAESYYHMAIQQAVQNKSSRYQNLAYTGLAEHYNRVQKGDSCIWYSKKAVDVVAYSVFNYMSMKPARLLTELYQYTNCDSTLKYAKIVKVANDSLYNRKANQQLYLMTFEEELRQRDLAQQQQIEEEKRRENIQYALLAIVIITLVSLFILLSHRFITSTRFIHFFSVVAMLMVFEFLNLVLHPFLGRITHHTPALMLVGLVCIAAILVPLHHRLEKWATEKLVEKNRQVRLEMAKRTIEKLEGELDNK